MKACPYCEAKIANNAKKCKHCGEVFVEKNEYRTCPFCKKEIPGQAKKCMYCRKRIDKEFEKSYNKHSTEYKEINPEREKTKEEFVKNLDKQQYNNSFLNKINACQPFLKEVVIARISLVIPAIAGAIIHDSSVIMLIPIGIIGLILSVWLYGREKFLNGIIFFGTWAFVICMWISIFGNS